MSRIAQRGVMLVLSSPSGAGKSSLARELLRQDNNIVLSISVTTRFRRPSEIDGVHYYFIDQKRFKDMQERDALLEYAEVHGNYYGSPREPVEEALDQGKDVLFDIDWQGAQQIYEKVPQDLVRIFVLPPSIAELKARLERRAEDSEAVISKRLANAGFEMEHWKDYDYVLINEDWQQALNDVRAILHAERLRCERRIGLGQFVNDLISQI